MLITSLFSYSSTRSIQSTAHMRGAAGLARSKPLHGDCNKWSAPSRVYPLTGTGVPPGERFASHSNNHVHKIICSVPSRPEVNPRGGSKSGGPPIRKIGWSATTQGCQIPRHQITCYSIWFELHRHFQPFFATLPPSPERISHCFGSARLGSGKRILIDSRERGHLCNLSNYAHH